MRREDAIEVEAYLICDDWNNELWNISAIDICLQFQIYSRVLYQNKGRSHIEGYYSLCNFIQPCLQRCQYTITQKINRAWWRKICTELTNYDITVFCYKFSNCEDTTPKSTLYDYLQNRYLATSYHHVLNNNSNCKKGEPFHIGPNHYWNTSAIWFKLAFDGLTQHSTN